MADEGQSETQPTSFDPTTFRNEILESNKSMHESLLESVKQMVSGALSGATAAAQPIASTDVSSKDYADFKQEMEDLGLSPLQAERLDSFVQKSLSKVAPGFEQKVLQTIDANTEWKSSKDNHDRDAAMKFPDVLNETSPLRQKAMEIYAKMPADAKKFPDATKNAVLQAASHLGIAPVSMETLNAQGAANPNRFGTPSKKVGPSKDQMDFAASFGVSPEKFKEKFNSRMQ